ncbi:hypothetical protein UFOVP415_21 [uncultured Caudovirales phage]|uniref:Uncharacterized protein n=1 Tax=uncultured Caudovirales phage TaxID=2100421 RepID=A0A6J5M4G0_9CAUD|nr:hypothetical protein UFOVP415_21 [uncultured Caudovirales phage]
MARIRTIKPEFWRDELLAGVTAEAALLAIGLLNHCDDEGYFNANPKLVESDIFPLRTLAKSTTELLRELSGIGYIEVFSGSDGKTYGKVANFEKHQVINKKTLSKIKGLCELRKDYDTPTVVLPTGKERKGKEMEQKAPESAATEVAFVLPDWIPLETWTAFLEMRKRIKKPATEFAKKLIVGKLEKFKSQGQDVVSILEKSITSGWQDVFEIKENKTFAQQAADIARTTVSAQHSGPDPVLLKIEADRQKATPMPDHIRQQINQVLRKA